MLEKWSRWQPLEHLYATYRMDVFMHAENGDLLIELSPSQLADKSQNHKKVRIVFNDWVCAYRLSKREKRIRTLRDLSTAYGEDFCGSWSFFTVQNSAYRHWVVVVGASGIRDNVPFVHYVLLCDNQVVDILSSFEPIVSYVE